MIKIPNDKFLRNEKEEKNINSTSFESVISN